MATASSEQVTSNPCHLSGITRLCFSPDGASIFTGGSDSLVRIHNANDPDSEPGFHDNHTDEITSLSCSGSYLVTASLDNIARYFSYPENQFMGYVTRSSGLPIRWVSIENKRDRVAVCGDDHIVKIVKLADTTQVSTISDNQKAVRSASWDPSGKFLTTASCDGKLKVYDTSSDEPVILRILEGIIGPSESDAKTSCYVAWHPSGDYFAVPLRTNDIGVISKDGWGKEHTFSTDGHKAVVSELAWSPNGRYLASAAQSIIIVWSTESRSPVARYSLPEGHVSGLAWSPHSNLLGITSTDGSFHRWTKPVPGSLPSPHATEAQHAKRLERILDDDIPDGEDLFGDVEIAEAGEDIQDEEGEDDDGWIVDDEGAYGANDDEKRFRSGRTEVVNVTKAQPAFLPGSTAWKDKKRYLAFSMIGVVDATDQESHQVVNVEFHDKSARRGYHFQDSHKYSMASISDHGIAFAAASEGDMAGTIHYRPYDSWASRSEWSIDLLAGEEPVLIAAGGATSPQATGTLAVATSRGFIRFFSTSGVQRYVWRMADDVVCMTAGREAIVMVHREGGTTLDGCQNLRYTIMELDGFDIIQQGRIPLAKKTTLTWLGMTAEGVPAMFDSAGLLSVLDRFRRPGQGRWVPLLDSKALSKREGGKNEHYWPVGLTSTHMSCIILRGIEKEPWFPRPLMQEVELHMPMLDMDHHQGKLEESFVRGAVQLSFLRDLDADEASIRSREVSIDQDLLQLVQAACKGEALSRALDVSRLMQNSATVDAAAKVAAFYHFPGLQERIARVKGEIESRKRRLDRDRQKRQKAVEALYISAYGAGGANAAHAGASERQFSDFAPRQSGPRRQFGGKDARAETPVTARETYIPETPGLDDDEESLLRRGDVVGDDGSLSPGEKRKRDDELRDESDGFSSLPSKKRSDDASVPSNGPAKNPFSKKAGGNPFAKPAVAVPLSSIKSTSFFDRVDSIESSGPPKPKKAGTKAMQGKTAANAAANGKQTTLLGMKKTKTVPSSEDVENHGVGIAESATETQTEDAETQMSEPATHILEESMVQETVGSPEWAMDEDD